jgi:hypothetical protein
VSQDHFPHRIRIERVLMGMVFDTPKERRFATAGRRVQT